MILSLMIAIPLGVIAAVKHRTPIDYLVSFTSFLGFSTSAFWLALMLILIFCDFGMAPGQAGREKQKAKVLDSRNT